MKVDRKRDELDEDTSLVKLLSTPEDKTNTTDERVQQVERNINGGGFIGDEVPIKLPSTDFQANDPLNAYEAGIDDKINSVSHADENAAQPKDNDDVNIQGYEVEDKTSSLVAKLPTDDNAQKREEERYEATIMNPNPRPRLKAVSQDTTESFINTDITDLNQAERHMEMEEGDAGKETNDTDKANETLQTDVGNKGESNVNKVDKDEKDSTNLKYQGKAISEFTSKESQEFLEPHHGLDSKNDDMLVLKEEKLLSKRLNFLKSKIKLRQELSKDKQTQQLSEVAANVTYQPNPAKTKYVMHRIDLPANSENSGMTLKQGENPLGSPQTSSNKLSTFGYEHNETAVGKARQHLQLGLKKELFAFSYDAQSPFGPPSWQTLNPEWTCSGRKQSPINIDNRYIMDDQIVKNTIVKVFPSNAPLTGLLRNNGHAPTLSLSNEVSVKLFGGSLKNDYYLKQMHFHFGCNSLAGSEHHIDGVTFPIEVHLVFWDNSTFVSFPDAAKADRGIVVLAVLYQMEAVPYTEIKNTPMWQVTQVLRHVQEEGDEITINEEFNFRLEKLIPNVINLDQTDRFFTYEGSLTTPGCYESVTWIVYATHPPVTENQLQIFRNLKSTKVGSTGFMCDNYRPVQKKHGRRIYSNIV